MVRLVGDIPDLRWCVLPLNRDFVVPAWQREGRVLFMHNTHAVITDAEIEAIVDFENFRTR